MQLIKKLLIFSEWYEPGYKAGGPIRSIVNMVASLKDSIDIFIVTTNQDFDDPEPYPLIIANIWITLNERINVYYFSKGKLTYQTLKTIIGEIKPDTVYINSMWSLKFTIFPLMIMKNGGKSKIVLSPRGMLNDSAIQFKKSKKILAIFAYQKIGMIDKVIFHATDANEKKTISKYFKNNTTIEISNFPSKVQRCSVSLVKNTSTLTLVFISRICKTKNLKFILEILSKANTQCNYSLNIYGPIEDEEYFNQCFIIAKSLSDNIKVNYCGVLPNELVVSEVQKHHFFILPTLGENFGHAIYESFAVGRPVIISDQTPWRDLQKNKVGFDISLSDPSTFVSAIEHAANMDQKEYDEWCVASLTYAKEFSKKSNLKEKYLELFN